MSDPRPQPTHGPAASTASAVRPSALKQPARSPATTLPGGAAPPPLPLRVPSPPAQVDEAVAPPPPPDDGWSDAPTVAIRHEDMVVRLTEDTKKELRAFVHAAVDEAVAPLVRAVQDLAALLERVERERRERPDARVVEAIPAPSAPPPLPAAPAHVAVVHPAPVVALPRPAPRYDLTIDSSPVDLPDILDGSRRRKRLGWFAALLLVMLVGGVALMAILSHQHG